mmetsp:Transcript_41885/g.87928  ORF Transcript_41885/g.87928 Transcript_41885/m.87928 type:complete len:81 (-) Transcript_41885:820-1062(-)
MGYNGDRYLVEEHTILPNATTNIPYNHPPCLPSIGQCHIPMAPASASSSHVFQNNNQQRHHQILRRRPRTVNENEHERGR